MAPILTIFGPNRSRRPKPKFEEFFRAVVAVVVGVVVVDRRRRGVGGMPEPLNQQYENRSDSAMEESRGS